ncbi:hypothetical protein RBWH47_01472 [Rhodopirellula baltica WH47]|uniref:Uncharacterized protein n=1 Tax=Rhodopirellula baltica WH47 TaxID=991778 RepID=F2ALU2_RHOBT|nr:hypothetical protein RBWH47_01472 [Rhodopirellula baltica WH47]
MGNVNVATCCPTGDASEPSDWRPVAALANGIQAFPKIRQATAKQTKRRCIRDLGRKESTGTNSFAEMRRVCHPQFRVELYGEPRSRAGKADLDAFGHC